MQEDEYYEDMNDGELAVRLGGIGWLLVAIILAAGAMGIVKGMQWYEHRLVMGEQVDRATGRVEP